MIALFQLEASRSGGVTLSADSGGGDAPGGFDSSVTLPAALRQGGALSVVSALTGRLSLPKCAAQLRGDVPRGIRNSGIERQNLSSAFHPRRDRLPNVAFPREPSTRARRDATAGFPSSRNGTGGRWE
jgi:hypothetical protein